MMRASDIRAQLRKRYCEPTHAIFFEVADATGARHTGFADAIAMSLWPSHGLALDGFEIKVSRSDWKRELENPMKAEKFARRCDRWWIVTCEGVIAEAAEIPDGWGWILASMEGTTIRRQATKLEPLPLDRNFLAALLRSAGKAGAAEIESICQQRVADLRADDEKRILERVNFRRGEDKRAAETLAKVTAILGEQGRWSSMLNDDEMAAAIVAVYKTGVAGTYHGLGTIAAELERAAEKIRGSHASLALPPPEKKAGRRPRASAV